MRLARAAAGSILIYSISAMLLGCATQRLATSGPHGGKSDSAGPIVAELPEVSDAKALPSRVTRVTVFSDRAQVTRQTEVELAAEPTVLALRKLPGWVDDGSVRVAVSAGRIVDVRVERSFLARATDRTWQQAKAQDQALQSKLDAIDDELAVLDAQKAQIEAIKAFSLEKISKDTLIGNIKVQSYSEVLAFIGNALRAAARARREAQRQREAIKPEHDASQRRLAEMQNLMKLEETTVLVTVQGSRAGKATLELSYMIPGVTWEPMHDLRVSAADPRTAELTSFAVVTQTSGEDWHGVELAFATQSSTESVRIPELEALTLGDTQTATRTLTSQMSSFTRAQDAFQQQGQLWNKVHQKRAAQAYADFDRVFKGKMEYLQVVQSKTVEIFESLQKRGTTAQFKASTTASVRGDGHPVRVRIGHAALATRQKIVAVPEQSLNAARTLETANSSGQAFLPGKVALYRDGAFLGMTEIDFIAQEERFSLFLNVADQLKLSRRLDRKHSSLLRKKRNKMQVAFIVTVENLSAQETAIALADRVPVSENKEIKIDNVRVTDGVKPDSRGILHWSLTLKPREQRQLRIAYQVEYPAELILETRRKQAVPSPAAASPSRAMPAPARRAAMPSQKKEIGEQLLDLESQF